MPNPVPQDTMQAVFTAGLYVGAERQDEAQWGIWGVRFHRLGNVTDWPADCQAIANALVTKFNTHITGKSMWSTAVQMETVKVNHYEASTGKVLDQGEAAFTAGTAWVGTGATSLPWETSLCISLYGYGAGFVQDKRRKRGRFYLPPMATTVLGTQSGNITDTVLGDIRDQYGALLNDVQGMNIGSGSGGGQPDYWDLRVISKGTKEKPLPPTSTQIVRMQLDSKVDSQRRRERQQPGGQVASAAITHADPP